MRIKIAAEVDGNGNDKQTIWFSRRTRLDILEHRVLDFLPFRALSRQRVVIVASLQSFNITKCDACPNQIQHAAMARSRYQKCSDRQRHGQDCICGATEGAQGR
jgi:hypothetical protein